MDETSHQSLQEDSDFSAKEGTGSLKEVADGEQRLQIHQKNSDVFNSDTVFETNSVNTNGIDSELMNAESESLESAHNFVESESNASKLVSQSNDVAVNDELTTLKDNSNDESNEGTTEQFNFLGGNTDLLTEVEQSKCSSEETQSATNSTEIVNKIETCSESRSTSDNANQEFKSEDFHVKSPVEENKVDIKEISEASDTKISEDVVTVDEKIDTVMGSEESAAVQSNTIDDSEKSQAKPLSESSKSKILDDVMDVDYAEGEVINDLENKEIPSPAKVGSILESCEESIDKQDVEMLESNSAMVTDEEVVKDIGDLPGSKHDKQEVNIELEKSECSALNSPKPFTHEKSNVGEKVSENTDEDDPMEGRDHTEADLGEENQNIVDENHPAEKELVTNASVSSIMSKDKVQEVDENNSLTSNSSKENQIDEESCKILCPESNSNKDSVQENFENNVNITSILHTIDLVKEDIGKNISLASNPDTDDLIEKEIDKDLNITPRLNRQSLIDEEMGTETNAAAKSDKDLVEEETDDENNLKSDLIKEDVDKKSNVTSESNIEDLTEEEKDKQTIAATESILNDLHEKEKVKETIIASEANVEDLDKEEKDNKEANLESESSKKDPIEEEMDRETNVSSEINKEDLVKEEKTTNILEEEMDMETISVLEPHKDVEEMDQETCTSSETNKDLVEEEKETSIAPDFNKEDAVKEEMEMEVETNVPSETNKEDIVEEEKETSLALDFNKGDPVEEEMDRETSTVSELHKEEIDEEIDKETCTASEFNREDLDDEDEEEEEEDEEEGEENVEKGEDLTAGSELNRDLVEEEVEKETNEAFKSNRDLIEEDVDRKTNAATESFKDLGEEEVDKDLSPASESIIEDFKEEEEEEQEEQEEEEKEEEDKETKAGSKSNREYLAEEVDKDLNAPSESNREDLIEEEMDEETNSESESKIENRVEEVDRNVNIASNSEREEAVEEDADNNQSIASNSNAEDQADEEMDKDLSITSNSKDDEAEGRKSDNCSSIGASDGNDHIDDADISDPGQNLDADGLDEREEDASHSGISAEEHRETEFHFESEKCELRNDEKEEDALAIENPISSEAMNEDEDVQCDLLKNAAQSEDVSSKIEETNDGNLAEVDVFHMDINEKENQDKDGSNDKGGNDAEEMDVDRDVDMLDTNLDKEDEDKGEETDDADEKEERDEEMEDKDESRKGLPKEVISMEENEVIEQPGNSEEETITGDTSSQAPAGLTEGIGKDAEVCIIPDDVTPRITISVPKAKSHEKTDGRKTKEKVENGKSKVSKTIRVATPEMEKPKGKADKSGLEHKGRPVRSAAKLAGNKIKNLVENDLVGEEPSEEAREIEETEPEKLTEPPTRMCAQCKRVKLCKFQVVQAGRTQHLCCDSCYNAFLKGVAPELDVGEVDSSSCSSVRKCAMCHLQVKGDDKCLSWETMEFCNEDCLGKYQTELGSVCANCRGGVASVSLGKYCVRFGYDVKQFCAAACLEEYKKGLKVCSYCQKDISSGMEGFLAPVGDKGQFKDFCTQSCMEKYEQMSSNTPPPEVIAECAVCSNSKPVRVEVDLDSKTQKLCSEPCFAAFKFVNNITEGHCDMCKKYFDRMKSPNLSIFYDDSPHSFCCKTCMNVYILAHRKIVPCSWCKVKKYNFDMIKKANVAGKVLMVCSLNCMMLYQVSINAVSSRRIKCDFCLNVSQAQYHLTMSDATIRNFCGYNCVMSFQNQYSKQPLTMPGTEAMSPPIPTGGPKRVLPRRTIVDTPCVPVISSVQSLASPNGPVTPSPARESLPTTELNLVSQVTPIAQPITIQSSITTLPAPAPPPPQVYQQIITKPPPAKQMKNKSTLCKPYSHTKGVSCRPHPCMKETQTDESLNRKCLIPIPVPIYVPAPMHMYASPFPIAVPFPLPVPVPIFIPTTRNSAKGIFKEIKKIQEKIPTDPFEAELLMMAEMVAGEKKQDPTDSESEEGNEPDDTADATFSPENVDTSNTFGDDMLQMALKMASESLGEPAVDMESVLTSNTITPSCQPTVDPNKSLYASDPDDPDQVPVMSMNRGRKRSMRGARSSPGVNPSKRGRRTSGSVDVPMLPPPEPVPAPRIEVEKPDANMCLKYTFGVNAWRHWVMQKNAELEKAALTNRKIKLFKPELLQLTADELNFSLCLFVKEVRKPNGTEYAPDTIYYLCLGIQQYLFENGRIDNIFTDAYYEKFTDCLDEVAKKFAALYNDSQYIVTRVEEEHLWESKQLGAHSPHVLLSTLMFFNTKHFNLVTVEEHMQLSFSHIMKHWKRNPNAPGVAKVPGSRNVLLRFYPPQSALEANSRKKKVYEQQENEENPLRCPVKLYEFYLSKCPESVKTRNDVFYLLPERSCVPDSPVWYSTMALGKEPLMKMLHRVKMVKEINIALLTC